MWKNLKGDNMSYILYTDYRPWLAFIDLYFSSKGSNDGVAVQNSDGFEQRTSHLNSAQPTWNYSIATNICLSCLRKKQW